MLARALNSAGGGGGEITASSKTYALTAGASTWTTIPTTDITVDGYMCCVIVNNYTGMKWRNNTKGTSGDFTDYYATGSYGYQTGYAYFAVSKGDSVEILSYSSVSRNMIAFFVGN